MMAPFVLRGWRLSSKTWNRITSPWMKQVMWLRIVQHGGWCLHLALHILIEHARKEEESLNTSGCSKGHAEYVKKWYCKVLVQYS